MKKLLNGQIGSVFRPTFRFLHTLLITNLAYLLPFFSVDFGLISAQFWTEMPTIPLNFFWQKHFIFYMQSTPFAFTHTQNSYITWNRSQFWLPKRILFSMVFFRFISSGNQSTTDCHLDEMIDCVFLAEIHRWSRITWTGHFSPFLSLFLSA